MTDPAIHRIQLKKGKDRAVRNFHPWIFSGALGRVSDKIQSGDLVDVYAFEGDFVGRGYYGTSSIAVRLISFEQEDINPEFWKRQLSKALQLRKSLGFPSDRTNAFRWVHGEGDSLPGLVVDVYGHVAVMQAHHLGIWNARKEIADAILEVGQGWLKEVVDKSAETLPGSENLSVEYIHGEAQSGEIFENGNRFHVHWTEGQKTGFFLDQRDNRALLAQYAKGRTVLNAYCYSGGFSVYAAKAGASHVDSVDSSAKAIQWTKENMALNGASDIHTAITSDVTEFLKKPSGKYDLMVLDPPAFAKRLSVLEKGLRGYRHINAMAIRAIKPGGILFTFSCSQAVSQEAFQQVIFQAAQESRRFVRILHRLSQPADHPVSIYHPEGFYLKGLVLYVE
ncbi:MAG: class I SAM-dependent rRNA methyltransferase [Flavobacteriales bacterium]|nr:class I SAM-dependent rRNA methyltransferase [Flavobacteriales bacterium]MCB9449333.1 class I SAM-dependent rRNA methyltransferase [Flavobacteriales bacterium]